MIKKDNNPIVDALSKTNKDIILAGNRGTGKTTIINDAINNNDGYILINGTVNNMEYLFLKERNIYNLYHVCLIIKKILLNIKNFNFDEYMLNFNFFDRYINHVIQQIYFMSLIDKYEHCEKVIAKEIIDKPELLLDNLLGLISKKIDIKDFSIVIDDFDKIGGGSQLYQEFVYKRLKQYFRLIIAISDNKVVNNPDSLQKFRNDNEVIKLNYSSDIEMVRRIFLDEIKKYYIKTPKVLLKKDLYFSLDDVTIELMIKKTNGNLFDMLSALRYLFNHADNLDMNEYGFFMIDYIENVINKEPMITGVIIPERTLYINP